jgi:integrase
MQISIGNVLRVSIRNAYLRRGVFYYQRAVPLDLQGKYPAKVIKLNLKTADPIAAAKKVTALNRKYEAEWELLRADPASNPKATRVQAERLLADHGIDHKAPDTDDHAFNAFIEKLDAQRDAYAGGNEEVHREADPAEYLSPVAAAAVEIIKNPGKDRLSDALSFYLETHHKGDSETLRKSSNIAMESFIAVVGDKLVENVTREDGRAYIKAQASQIATTTIRRYLRSLVAILNHYIREKELDRKNPLGALKIAGEGEDAEERQPFTPEELKAIQEKCREADDEPRWLLAMLSDTGARLAEVAGLGLDDIKLDAEIPHVVVRPHPWRSLKNRSSERTIPLLGVALWAATRVKDSAKEGQRFAFPHYIKDGKCRADSVSATLAKWIRSKGMEHTPHELRHSMRDRLRKVQCSEEIIDGIGGWSRKSVGQGYGLGYDLEVKREWLEKIVVEK